MDKKKAFLLLCILAVLLAVFLLFPGGNETHGADGEIQKEEIAKESENQESKEEKPLRITEWDEEEFAEDKKSEILGTFARKEAEAIVFLYFDRQETYLKEVHRGEEITKELGSYHLKSDGTILNMGEDDFTFQRDGSDIIIDGCRWEFLEGIILSVV